MRFYKVFVSVYVCVFFYYDNYEHLTTYVCKRDFQFLKALMSQILVFNREKF
jgi:hypothetical protein